MSLNNKIVFITGASSGIGRASAIAFAKQGAKLILAARRVERLQALTKELDVPVYPMTLDVCDKKAVQHQLEALPQEWQAIDVLINNAGLARGYSSIEQGSTNDWEEMIDTNLKGLLYVTQKVAELMITRQQGHIINISSIAGREAYPNGNAYCASKAAVSMLSKAIKMDLVKHNIKVTSIEPGAVETEFSVVRFHGDTEKADNVYQGFTPLKPEDLADTILYVANTPAHVNITELMILPTAQASATIFHKK